MSGQAVGTYTSATANPPSVMPGDIWTTFDGGGVYYGGACILNVTLRFGSTEVGWCNYPGSTLQDERWLLVQGKGSLWWNARRIAYGNCGPAGEPCYSVTGQFNVEVEIPPVTFTVTASDTSITDAAPVTFTASATPDTIHGIPVPFVVQSTGWRWVPDSGNQVTACLNSPPNTNPETCTYTVAAAGEMHVDAVVQGKAVTEKIRVNRASTAGDSIVVTCAPNPVVRAAANITCSAAPSTAGQSLEIEGWQFDGPGGDDIVRMTEVTSTVWIGKVVVGGVVTATGRVAGRPAAGSTAMTVTPRDWTNRRPAGYPESHFAPGQGPLPVRPVDSSQLGLAVYELKTRNDVQAYLGLVDDGGPNHGLYYFSDIPWRTETLAYVNVVALSVGSDFYNAQLPKDKTVNGVKWCGKSSVVRYLAVVEAHEGTDPVNQPKSHVWLFLSEVWRLAGPASEGLTGTSTSLDAGPAQSSVQAQAHAKSQLADTDPAYIPTYHCRFNYTY